MMLAEPSFCRHLQWCTHDCLLPRCGPVGGKSRACAGGRKENNQRNQISSFPSSRHVPFGCLYEDDNSDSDTDRTTGLAAALSNTTSASATLTYEKSLEPQGPIVSSGTGKQTDKFVTDWLAMDSTSMDQMKDEDLWHFRHGPLPGDLAEVEAFCRIFRIAEQVHKAVMDALRSVSEAREDHSGSFDYNGSSIVDPDPESLEVQDVPLLEEKVVSSLGCIGAILHQEKQEVLSGRLSVGFTLMARHDSMPPLALFRAEMKRCCEELEALLLCYFPTEDDQFQPMHKKFQKLRNICLDAGYPRAEGSPNHADIPNWGPVRSKELWNKRASETDGEIVFWRGGQVTDDGLQWLIDKGFKVIVDMRAEDIRDYLAKTAVSAAVSSGKLKRVSLPIDPGSNPTKDQVMEFAKLVADVNNRPLYLHSQKGVGRTSAMVSRWREIGSLSSSMEVLTQSDLTNSPWAAEKKLGGSISQSESLLKEESDLMPSIATQDSPNAASTETSCEVGTTLRSVFVVGCTPFDAQRPPARSCFSRQEMSNFFRGRQVSPSTFRWKRSSKAVVDGAIQLETKDSLTESINEPAGRWYVNTPGIPQAGKRDDDDDVAVESAKSGLLDSYGHGDGDLNVVNCQKEPIPKASLMGSSQRTTPSNGAHSKVSGNNGNVMVDSEDVAVVGDMCASTTGVVRLQSRKKAEMYLVRTDGFTCTREKVKESTLAFTHPSTQQQMLMWKTAPKTVLLLKKLGGELMEEAQQVASFLHYKEGMNVIVEPDVHDHFARVPGFGFIQTFQNHDISNLHERVDFVVCLGGDGVILHASNLFRSAVPPVVSFNLGSLGFLTAHPFEDFMQDLKAIIHGNTIVEGVYITLRMRLRCELFRNGKSVPGKVFDVLNEVVVDRGSNPYLCKIECYERKRLITKVQADGVIIATPTGSTAYSTAAGGSMVHPNVPCMLFTPICPHSLSFRPVILPDSALLELKVPEDARSNAWVSFDGKRRQQMSRGDSVCICMSQHPLPTVNKSDQTDDWFQSLVRCLNWNERLEQKALPKIL